MSKQQGITNGTTVEPPHPGAKAKKQFLTQAQHITLAKAIEGDYPALQEKPRRKVDYAAHLSKRLGFRVKPSQVGQKVAALGLEWPKRNTQEDQANETMAALAWCMAGLCTRFNMGIPSVVRELADSFDGSDTSLFA